MDDRITALAIAATGLVAAAMLATTLTWEYQHDSAFLNYGGFLIARFGLVPYRDFIDTAMPGAFAFHGLVAAAGLTGNTAFMLLNAGLLVAAGLAAWWALRPVSRPAALLAAPTTMILAVMLGSENILQRDWLAVLPATLALALVTNGVPKRSGLRAFLVGLLFGAIATIKPQLAAAAPIVVAAGWALDGGEGAAFRRGMIAIGQSLAGFAIAPAAALAWLSMEGGLDAFLFILFDYIPLYLGMDGTHHFPPPGEAAPWFSGVFDAPWRRRFFAAAGLAALLVLALVRSLDRQRRIHALTLLGVWLFYMLVPALGGQFWLYHFMPAMHFTGLLAALAFAEATRFRAPPLVWAARIALLLAFALYAKGFVRPFVAEIGAEARGGRVARQAEALAYWTPEGGRVQPIDWISGGTHQSMLRAGLAPGTRYLLNFHFFHSVSSPVIARMRADFLAELSRRRPEVVLVSHLQSPVTGWDTTERFPERDRYIAENYRAVEETPEYTLLLREDLDPPPPRIRQNR